MRWTSRLVCTSLATHAREYSMDWNGVNLAPTDARLIVPVRFGFSLHRAQKKPACAGLFFGAPGEIRTPDHLVRSQVLCPAELRARN